MSIRRTRRQSSCVLQLDENAKQVVANRRASIPSMEPLEDMVTCPIDLNLLVDPRLLPCGHAFCCDCLTHYMCQLSGSVQTPNVPVFACPICRTNCPIPESKSANFFPKAFNHIVILEFLQKSQMANFKTPSAPPLPNGAGDLDQNGGQNRYPTTQTRKSSIQVSSQMLNYIVNDITSRQLDGRIEAVDRAVIMDDVSRLLQQLQPSIIQRPDRNHMQPQANPNKGARAHKKGTSSTSSCSSPTGSVSNLGRFHSFAGRVRRRASSAGTESSYIAYRDVESVRLAMRSNAIYLTLTKGKDCCIMRPGELLQPVDMQMLSLPDSTQLLRCTLTATKDRTNLVMWHQKVDLVQAGGFLTESRRGKHNKSLLVQSSGPVIVPGFDSVRVQYVRFYKNKIFLTAIISPKHNESCLETEYGLVICCQATSLTNSNDQEKPNTPSAGSPFPVLATSCIFRRDSVGMQLPDEPIVGGLDIDQSNGDVYLTQPANAMICRLKTNDLLYLDGTWYLNEPQLSPYFLCYVKDAEQIWATCLQEDKMIILDLETNGYYHFTPTISFGIDPSHIIHTSDGRIVALDQKQSRMFWISKVQQTICVQCLDVQFTTRSKRHFLVIQPVDDTINEATNHFIASSNSKSARPSLRGGILCAHDHGCSVIYPKCCLSSHIRSFNFDCTSFFSCGV